MLFFRCKYSNNKKGIEKTNKIEGRFNVIEFSGKKVIIDFAHTPDGLENVLKTAKQITDQKLYCLFGCGGNRDKQKRSIMGAIAEKYANYTYITTDNPRFEDPQKIMDDISSGFNTKNYCKIEDRTSAIHLAINNLKAGDTLLVCGKGSEDYIEVKGQKLPYSDYQTVNKIIKEQQC